MFVREFIYKITTGELTKNDILAYAKGCEDIFDLNFEIICEAIRVEAHGDRVISRSYDGSPSYAKDYCLYNGEEFGKVIKRLLMAKECVGSIIQQQRQQRLTTTTKSDDFIEPHQIPTIIGTEQEINVFTKAIEKRYMMQNGSGYKWNLTKSLCAYMCGRLYCGDRIKEDDVDYSRKLIKGNTQLPRNELKKMFGFNVGENRGTMKEPPRNVYMIEDLFDDKGKP